MLADVLAACGERKDAFIDAAELAARFKLNDEELEDHLQLLNLVNFGGGCYAVYAERVEDGRTIHVEKELYGDEFRRPARLSPLEAKSLLLALDLVGPLVAADAGTALDDVRAKLETAFGRYDMRGAPTPQPTPLDEDVLSVLSAAVRSREVVEIEYLGRQDDSVKRRVVEPHYLRGVRGDWYCDTWDRTRDGERTFRVDRIREAKGLGETFERRESVTARVDGALGDRAGTASVWFSADVARWELEQPRRHRAAGRRRRHRVGAVRLRALPLRRAVPLPRRGRPARARGAARPGRGARARARRRRARARHHQRAVTVPQARWLSDAEVAALLPPPAEAAELARAVLVELAEGTIELPPKPSIHPRPDGFVNVMPAYCAGMDGSGVKLVSVFPANREGGLPAINALVIVLDSATGLLRGLLGGAALTACRTAAASAACIARLAPAAPGHVAITGAGVEARSHLLALDALGLREVVVWDHRATNLEALAAWAGEHAPEVALRTAASATDAAVGAAIVITGIPIGASGGVVAHEALRPDALTLPIDYSTSIAAETANEAELLLADDVGQLDGFRGAYFGGWRTLDGPVGRWLADGAPARPAGQVVVANLGVGAHDVIFGSAVLARAEREGIGVLVTP